MIVGINGASSLITGVTYNCCLLWWFLERRKVSHTQPAEASEKAFTHGLYGGFSEVVVPEEVDSQTHNTQRDLLSTIVVSTSDSS